MIDKVNYRGLIAVLAAALRGGCGWFGDEPSVGSTTPARAGADRSVVPANALPPAPAGRAAYDGGGTILPETSPVPIGSVVATKGGQQTQKEALEKQAMDRDAAAREARDRARAAREGAPKDPDTRPADAPAAPPSAAPSSDTPASTTPGSADPPSDRPPS